jgi:4'-phosphopantetheinyl transferase
MSAIGYAHGAGDAHMRPRETISNVQIFLIDIDDHRAGIGELSSLLAEDEIERMKGFSFDIQRERYAIVRGLLRRIVSGFTGVPSSEIRFEYNRYGKPRIPEWQNKGDIRFNVAHSQDYGIIAISGGKEIGVDIEVMRPIDGMRDVAERVFSARETKEIFAIADEGTKLEAFYRRWVQKEAALKAVGKGIASDLAAPDAAPKGECHVRIALPGLVYCLFILDE